MDFDPHSRGGGGLCRGFRCRRYSGIVRQCFADEVARETTNNNVFAQFRDFALTNSLIV